MDVLGVDLSLTATGLADESDSWVVKHPGSGIARERQIAEDVIGAAMGKTLVVIEHFGHLQGPAVFVIEIHGIVKYLLDVEGIPFATPSAPALKKWATSKGNAGKDEMLAIAIRRYGFEGFDNNAADAHLLRLMGLAWIEHSSSGRELPGYQLEAMAKVSWPSIEREEVGAQT